MQSLVVSLVVASVFTLGGYGIMRAEKHAEMIGGVLFLTFSACALLTAVTLVDQLSENRSYTPANHSRGAQRTGPTLVSTPKASASSSVPPLSRR